MIPKAIEDSAVTFSRTGYQISIQCDNLDEANEIFAWLESLPGPPIILEKVVSASSDFPATDKILQEVAHERKKQDEKWGQQNHSPADFLMILGEEVGEANKAALEHRFANKPLDEYRKELVQVAAVAVAMIEAYDRTQKE